GPGGARPGAQCRAGLPRGVRSTSCSSGDASMRIATLALAALATLTLAPLQAPAVDTSISREGPDLTSVRAKIKAKDFQAALTELNGMIERNVQHADVYNLLGFSLRKTGDYPRALTFY